MPHRPAKALPRPANRAGEAVFAPVLHVGAASLDPGLRQTRRVTGFGIFDPSGRPVQHTEIRTASWQSNPVPGAPPAQAANRILGPALFAGSVDKQFGFVLLNALGRLWALASLPAETVLVYAAKPIRRPSSYPHLPMILGALGLSHPVIIAEAPLRFDDLITAPELFGECRDGTGDAAFYDWIDRRWPAPRKPAANRRIYVTRSGLGPAVGRFACEDMLESLLRAQGYEVYAPEQHPVRHQVDTFQSASTLIFAEGSAAHLFALVKRPGQTVILIQRRREVPSVMLTQLADRDGAAPIAVNVVMEEYWPPERGEHLSVATLDFGRLRDALVAAGALSADAAWSVPAPADVAASLSAGLPPGQTLLTGAERTEFLKTLRKGRRQ